MSSDDQQVEFYNKLLASLVGKKIRRAGMTKTGVAAFIETDDEQIVFYAQCGDTKYPVDLQRRPLS